MTTIKGKWKWNEVITQGDTLWFQTFLCNFESNGEKCVGFYFNRWHLSYIVGFSSFAVCDYSEEDYTTCTMQEEYRLIDFGQNEQEIDDNLYNFIVANAEAVPQTIAEKLQAIAENEQKVFDAGKKSEYDAFWDELQNKGQLTNYSQMFGGGGWTNTIFKPKYPMTPTAATDMFRGSGIENIDNASIDFSNCKRADFLFYQSSRLKKLPELNLGEVTTLQYALQQCVVLETIDEIILPDYNNIVDYKGFLDSCRNLKNVVFEGTIGKNNFNLQGSTLLSKSSIESVISCLSTTTTNLSVTFSKTAVNKAFETSEGANDGEASAKWTELVDGKTNWTITLV